MAFTEQHYEQFSEFTRINPIEVLDLFEGDKPAVFGQIMDDTELDRITRLCNELGMTVKNFDIVVDSFEADYRVVIGNDTPSADTVEEHVRRGNWRAIGEMIGYPDCCADAYAEAAISDGDPDSTIPEKVTSLDPFPFYNNRFLRMNRNRTLLSHFPCGYDCEHSAEMAANRLDLLREYDPDKATDLVEHLQSFIVYVHRDSVMYARDYTRDGNTVTHDGFESGRYSTDEDLLDQLNETDTVTVNAPNSITIGDEVLEGDDVAVAFFEDLS